MRTRMVTALALALALAVPAAAHTQGDALTVTYKGVTTSYRARSPLPDGAGMVICPLELVTP